MLHRLVQEESDAKYRSGVVFARPEADAKAVVWCSSFWRGRRTRHAPTSCQTLDKSPSSQEQQSRAVHGFVSSLTNVQVGRS